MPAGANYVSRAVKYQDVEYEVAALVVVPSALSYRYYGADEFIMNDQTFLQDTGTDSVMYYAFDTTDEANAGMETFLQDYTENVNPQFDYESKATYAAEFEGMRAMFLMLAGAELYRGTGGRAELLQRHPHRHHGAQAEFAVLQSIGMTGKQLKTMLVYEGLLYALGAVVISLVLAVVLSPLAFRAVGNLFLVLHLPLHHFSHFDCGSHLRAAGHPGAPGSVPLCGQVHHCRAAAGGGS